ncbi:MAG: 2-dehydro-3-deoxyglucarate aldolase [Deltaproteobacteria bacterium]|jgi:4-hydroxy-2-oxoheptanedioate aldolase|nr:2-dehydro-3-deoxyglucarate aldolase [Deltaproteobacteria bacterium]
MNPNQLKLKLRNGQPAYGTFVKFDDPAAVEVLALSGLDFFVLDNEHVAMNRERLTNMIRAAEAFQITPLIRVKENQTVEILQNLDLGFAGIQAPNIDTIDQARNLVASVKYAPLGKRGFSPSVRACRYGTMDINAYIETSNDQTMVIAHCETKECVSNLDEILTVPGLDVIFLGPMDLSQSLGVTGQTNSPLVKDAMDQVMAKTLAANLTIGTVAPNAQAAKALTARGVKYILISSDQGMILQWAKAVLKELKG